MDNWDQQGYDDWPRDDVERAIELTWMFGTPDRVEIYLVDQQGRSVGPKYIRHKIDTCERFHRRTGEKLIRKEKFYEGCQSFRRHIFMEFPEKALAMAKAYARIAQRSPTSYVEANRQLLAWSKRLRQRTTRDD